MQVNIQTVVALFAVAMLGMLVGIVIGEGNAEIRYSSKEIAQGAIAQAARRAGGATLDGRTSENGEAE